MGQTIRLLFALFVPKTIPSRQASRERTRDWGGCRVWYCAGGPGGTVAGREACSGASKRRPRDVRRSTTRHEARGTNDEGLPEDGRLTLPLPLPRTCKQIGEETRVQRLRVEDSSQTGDALRCSGCWCEGVRRRGSGPDSCRCRCRCSADVNGDSWARGCCAACRSGQRGWSLLAMHRPQDLGPARSKGKESKYIHARKCEAEWDGRDE
jgi:hypothetical protein